MWRAHLLTHALMLTRVRSAMISPAAGRGSWAMASRCVSRGADRELRMAMDVTESGREMRTRFAPSPTGSLHVGGARTALFSWLKAKQEGGKFIIRVEDTDTARSTRESEASVLQDLKWLGLDWDEGPIVEGDKGPYRQSERMEQGIYQELAVQLMAGGHAYHCFCSQEELDAKRAAAEAAGENPQYDGMWRDADPAEVQRRLDAGEPYAVRFRCEDGAKVAIEDAVRGSVEWDVAATVGDFILLRSSGMPVYNFCVAVDDALMDVSTVVRAEEHLTNTVRQVLILEALGYQVPRYAHLSLVLGEDRSKLSKRHGATSVDQFRKEGFLPEAMINYLCLLGWNDATDQDIYTRDELIKAFSLSRVTKSPAVFDMKKLRWINGQHLRALPTAQLAGLIDGSFREHGVWAADAADADTAAFSGAAASMVADKVELVNDATTIVRNTLDYPLLQTLADSPQLASGLAEVAATIVATHRNGELPDVASADFAAAWKAWTAALGKVLGLKGKALFMPMRVALTGRGAGPDLPAQLQLLSLAEAGGAALLSGDVDVSPMAERMAILEKALGTLPIAEDEAAAPDAAAPDAAAPAKVKGDAAAAAAAAQPDVSKLDLRVGKILSAERHPDAEKLYVETVDLGEESGPRTVVSGLVDFMSAEDLVGRRCVLVCNLKPAKMRGIESAAMVLGASDAERTKVELLVPPEECALGERVCFDGHDGEPLAPKTKKEWGEVAKAWEASQPDFSTTDDRVAQYKSAPFATAHGPCTVATIANGKIK